MRQPGLLHIYGQDMPHDDVLIKADRKGLVMLKNAIDRALMHNRGITTEVTTNDGESYDVLIELIDKDWQSQEWQEQKLPYWYLREVREG